MSSTQEVGQIFGEGSGPATAMLRSPTVIIASIGLWGMNVYFFRLFGIDYVRVLNYDLVKERESKNKTSPQSGTGVIASAPSSGGSASHLDGTGGKKTADKSKGKKVISDKESDVEPDFSDNHITPLANGSDEMVAEIPKKTSHLTTQESTPTVTARHRINGSTESAHNQEEEEEIEPLTPKKACNNGVEPSGNNDVTSSKLLGLSFLLLVLLHVTTFFWIRILGRGTIGAIFAFYGAVTIGVVLPFPTTRWLRTACVIVLQRALELIYPRSACVTGDAPRPIPFIDVFFADGMCSLSKVFFDWGILFHMASHYPEPVPQATHSIVIPSFCAAIPYIIRARQCIVMHTVGKLKNDSKRYQHVLNAIKYSTSIFPLCLSAYQKTVSAERAESLENFLIFLLTVNALYALAWDVVMDWGMMQNPTAVFGNTCMGDAKPTCGHILRPRLRFGVIMSTLILLADAILRFSWLLRFHEKFLFPSKDSFVLCTQFLEVFRRAIWNLLRVEWENIKQMKARTLSLGRSSSDKYDIEEIPFIAPPKSIQMIPTRTGSSTR